MTEFGNISIAKIPRVIIAKEGQLLATGVFQTVPEVHGVEK